jgi:hypothetical protein
MTFILLTKAQADRVRYSDPGKSGLDPIEQEDGTFFLNKECTADPRHGDYLKTLPTLETPRPKWAAQAAVPLKTATIKR